MKRKDHSNRSTDNETSKELTRARQKNLSSLKKTTNQYEKYQNSKDQYLMSFAQFKRKLAGQNFVVSAKKKKKKKKNNIKQFKLSDHSLRKKKKLKQTKDHLKRSIVEHIPGYLYKNNSDINIREWCKKNALANSVFLEKTEKSIDKAVKANSKRSKIFSYMFDQGTIEINHGKTVEIFSVKILKKRAKSLKEQTLYDGMFDIVKAITVKYIKFHTPYDYSSKQHKKIAISKTVKSHDVSAANYGVDYILGKKK